MVSLVVQGGCDGDEIWLVGFEVSEDSGEV
jgi:hypothetical protein